MRARAGVTVATLLALACARRPGMPAAPPQELAHHGPDRLQVAYDDPRAGPKQALLARINADRLAEGVPPVAYSSRAALVGDHFCLESAAVGSWGHWDLEGRAPYLRWAEGGGVDFHAQNAGAVSVSQGLLEGSLSEMLLAAHARMMAETPPADGHRRTVLDPHFTHVGIGAAVVGNQFRMTEEFVRADFEWLEAPAAPLRRGEAAVFRGQPRGGFEVGLVEIRYEPPPTPLTPQQIRSRGSYGYPPVASVLWASSLGGTVPAVTTHSDFTPGSRGEVEVRFRLDRGAGHYYVLAYLRPRGQLHAPLLPATAVLVTATE